MCSDFIYNFCLKTFLIVIDLHVKYPLFLSDFNQTLIFSTGARENEVLNFVKIRLVGAELFHADRRTYVRTEMTKLIVAFRNFANA
jgi:hypothetical protein